MRPMRRSLFLSFPGVVLSQLIAPGLAAGSPILTPSPEPGTRALLEVEYWGNAGASIGPDGKDLSHGKFLIDPALAGPDQRPDDPTYGRYTWIPDCEDDCWPPPYSPSGFVVSDRGFTGRGEHRASMDAVFVEDRGASGFILIQDAEDWGPYENLLFNLEIFGSDIIQGEGLVQSFDVDFRKDDAGGNAWFSWEQPGHSHTWTSVDLSRVRMRPKVCKL